MTIFNGIWKEKTNKKPNQTKNPLFFWALTDILSLLIVNYCQITLWVINWPFSAKTIKAILLIQQTADSTFCRTAISITGWLFTLPPLSGILATPSWEIILQTRPPPHHGSLPEGFKSICRYYSWKSLRQIVLLGRWVVNLVSEGNFGTMHKHKTLSLFSFLQFFWAAVHLYFKLGIAGMLEPGSIFLVLLISHMERFLYAKCCKRWSCEPHWFDLSGAHHVAMRTFFRFPRVLA